MTNVTVYDCNARDLEQVADKNDISVAEVLDMLMEYLVEMKEDNGLE